MALANERGIYIVLEGLPGCGKSTQMGLLTNAIIQRFGDNKNILNTYEPGGSEIADAIRRIVQATPFMEEMDPICEAYLYAASRAQTLKRVVKPARNKGDIVLSDRNFFSSRTIIKINSLAAGEVIPDRALIINVDPDVAMSRFHDKGGDKFETMDLDFFRRVQKGYLFCFSKFSGYTMLVDGNGTIEEVHREICHALVGILWD